MKRRVVCCLFMSVVLLMVQVNAFEFCDDGINGEEELRIISVDDMIREGGVEWIWQESDEVEIEVRVQNRGDDKKDYEVELIFVQDDSKERIASKSNDLEKEIELKPGERKSISFVFEVDDDADRGDYELYVKFYDKGDEDEECVENFDEVIKINTVEVCDSGNDDDLEIIKISDESDLDNLWEWGLGDKIEIEVDIENKNSELEDYIVELLLFDIVGEEVKFAKDIGNLEKETEISEDEEEDVTFNFEINLDVKDGSYYLYAKVYAEDDNSVCTSLKAERKRAFKKIIIEQEEHKVVVSSVEGPEELGLGAKARYVLNVVNLGNEDEEKVKVISYNRLLGLRKDVVIDDLKSGEEREVIIDLIIPENHSSKSMKILFSTEFEYDQDREIYLESSDDDDDVKFFVTLTQLVGIMEEKNETEDVNDTTSENDTVDDGIMEDFGIIQMPDQVEESGFLDSQITGAVVGAEEKEGSSSIMVILFVLILVVSFGVFLSVRSKMQKVKPYVSDFENHKVVRRYTAKLH